MSKTFKHVIAMTVAWRRAAVAIALGTAVSCAAADDGTPPRGRTCAPGTLDCGSCVDTASNLLHCGACDNPCATGQDCVSGQCSCIAGLSACGSSCADLREDPMNCGRCGNVCGPGLFCSNGACTSSCGIGLQPCGASCTDTRSSPLHCGGCGRTCEPGESCSNGQCGCTQGRIDCGSGCIDPQQDNDHCGRCNNPCDPNEMCVAGICRPTGSGGTGAGGSTSGVGGAGGSGGSGGNVATGGSGGSFAGSGGKGGASSSGGRGGTAGSSGSGGNAGNAGSGGGPPGCSRSGFYVQNKTIYDTNCNEFVMRGVNYPYAWFTSRNTQQDFDAIAAAGANAVRIVLASGGRWERVNGGTLTAIISAAKAAKLVSIVEVHDTTGWNEQSGSVELSNATNYWTSSDIANALKGQEAYVILNIANEPFGNSTSNQWATRHVTAVQILRNAGFSHLLMIDAPNWGQDWENIMRNGGGSSIWNADSQKNLVFSVHMYEVYGSSQTVSSYFNTFLDNNSAPLVVGEFAADHGSMGNVDEDAIMSFAESLGIGYLGWSWSGNGGGLGSLDITNDFNPSSLTTWGNRLINGNNGLKATSELCSCFD